MKSAPHKPNAKARILFVDDEPLVLTTLEATVSMLSPDWEVRCVENGAAALALMGEQPFDVVVSDMRMPGMSGAQLLNEVMRKYPRTARIIMTGYADMESVLKCVGAVHQYLHKPYRLETLLAALRRIREVNQCLRNEELRTLAARLTCPPSMPARYFELLNILQSPDASIAEISTLITRDPSLAAKVLQLVNSAFFGCEHQVSRIEEAVQVLGLGVIRSLTLCGALFKSFDASTCPSLPLGGLWDHSLQTGWLARAISLEQTQDQAESEAAFAGGLLHDIGKLILADSLGTEYEQILSRSAAESRPLHEIERGVLQASHAEVGGYLLGLWSLPAPLVEAVALHHSPSLSREKGFTSLAAVHIADALIHQSAGPVRNTAALLDVEFLEAHGVATKLPAWRRQFLRG